MAMSVGMPTFAAEELDITIDNYGLSAESIAFLEAHNVGLAQFLDSSIATENIINNEETISTLSALPTNEDMVQSLIRQSEANNFTDEQIQKYVEGALTTPTTIIVPNSSDATVLPLADNRPFDDGVGYEVKSQNGYYQTTAFAKIPTVYRKSETNAYMFYTVSDKLDIGIWYGSGTAGEGWRCCWKYENQAMETKYDILSGVTAGKSVYFNAEVIDNNWVQLKVLDGNDFSKVYMNYSFSTSGLGITKTNANWNRQITLCTTSSFTNGSYLLNGEFSQAYIYKTNGTYANTLPTNTVENHVGVFGTNSTTAGKVGVNSSSKWYQENISIRFN